MPKTPPDAQLPPQPDDEALEDSFYEVPAELKDDRTVRARTPAEPLAAEAAALEEPEPGEEPGEDPDAEPLEPSPRGKRPFPIGKVGLAVAVVAILGAVLFIFRAQERRRAVRDGIGRAEKLMQLDTAEGYRKAADLLAPLAQLDPLEAGSARAFALSMLAADYRDAKAEQEANALLVVPGRADSLPRYAALAFGALALGKNSLGDATSALGGAAGSPWTDALQARIALRAGTLEAAVGPATTAAAVAGFAPGLAVHGDVSRRARHDARAARTAYEAALAASPTHPRAAFGLAKLALAGEAPEAEAREALGRLLNAGDVTPAPERARAALHLAALRIRAGEPIDAVRGEAAAVVGEKPLDWVMGAARAEAAAKGPYRAVAGAPPSVESANDDDPPEAKALAPEPPPPPPPPAVEPPPPPPVKSKAAAHAAKLAKAGARASAKPAAKATAKPSAKAGAKAAAKPAAKPAAKAGAKAPAKPAAKATSAKKKPAGK